MSKLDKIAHGTISFALTAIIHSFLSIVTGEFWLMLLIAAVVTILIGVAKEVYDKLKGGSFDKRDLLADAIGMGLAVVYIIILRWIAQ